MAQFDIIMPKMGESITEATITQWFKKEGDSIEEDDILLEIATDKVDSEIPSPVSGTLSKVNFKVNDVVPVGQVIAVIDMGGESLKNNEKKDHLPDTSEKKPEADNKKTVSDDSFNQSDRFYSPLVKNIAKKENINLKELESIKGTGIDGRVTKNDMLNYLKGKPSEIKVQHDEVNIPKATMSGNNEVIEMDRMRKMIADHMVMSKKVSPHVTNFIEADVTELVLWRNKIKDEFKKREKVNFTFMPVFTEVVAKALRDFPMVNSSVDGYNIILHKNINVGIAVALPTGNLIVPVIKNADQKNLVGLANEINLMAEKARNNKLSPDDIQGGTFSISNFGSFRNIMGTPIINQPQTAILATGTIEKKPAVLETPTGDVIAIRHKMFLSLTYDHRVIDGAMGGAFLKKISDYLEQFDINRTI